MKRFTFTLFACLAVTWLLSGDRFLDSVFEMVDLGQVDDIIIERVIWLEERKASLGLPDVFGVIRESLHSFLGLG